MKKAILMIIAYLLCQVSPVFSYWVEDDHDPKRTRFVIREGNNWGYMDKKGQIVIKPRFHYPHQFHDDRAVFLSESKKFGYIDPEGNVAIKPVFDYARDFSEGLAAVTMGDLRNYTFYQTGFIDTSGRYVIPPENFIAEKFQEGYAVVITGKKITSINCGPSTGLYELCSQTVSNGLYGIIDRTGNRIIAPQNKMINHFSGRRASFNVSDKTRDVYGFYDYKGKVVLKADKRYRSVFYDGLLIFRENSKYGYLDINGRVVISPRYYDARRFSEGLACVVIDRNGYGFINKKGDLVISPRRFDWCKIFKEGLCAASAMGKWGYIDTRGRWAILPQFKDAYSFSNGIAMVKLKEKVKTEDGALYAYIDRRGKFIWKEQ